MTNELKGRDAVRVIWLIELMARAKRETWTEDIGGPGSAWSKLRDSYKSSLGSMRRATREFKETLQLCLQSEFFQRAIKKQLRHSVPWRERPFQGVDLGGFGSNASAAYDGKFVGTMVRKFIVDGALTVRTKRKGRPTKVSVRSNGMGVSRSKKWPK